MPSMQEKGTESLSSWPLQVSNNLVAWRLDIQEMLKFSNSQGSVKCEHCSGTGFRASWMEEPNCSVDPGLDEQDDSLGRQW